MRTLSAPRRGGRACGAQADEAQIMKLKKCDLARTPTRIERPRSRTQDVGPFR
jgi:hypothetical protein